MRFFSLLEIDPNWNPMSDPVPKFIGYHMIGYDEYGYPFYVIDGIEEDDDICIIEDGDGICIITD